MVKVLWNVEVTIADFPFCYHFFINLLQNCHYNELFFFLILCIIYTVLIDLFIFVKIVYYCNIYCIIYEGLMED